MHDDPSIVVWPDYDQFRRWLESEVEGLTGTQLDLRFARP